MSSTEYRTLDALSMRLEFEDARLRDCLRRMHRAIQQGKPYEAIRRIREARDIHDILDELEQY